MTAKELAARLSGRKIMQELSEAEAAEAASAGLVVVYGYSDDTIVFEGAITDDRGCFDGGIVFLTQNGLMPDCCPPSTTLTVPTTRRPGKRLGPSRRCGEMRRAGAMRRTSRTRSLIFSMTRMETPGKSGAGVLCSVWRM